MLSVVSDMKSKSASIFTALFGAVLALSLGAGPACIEQAYAAKGDIVAGTSQVEAQAMRSVYLNGMDVTNGGGMLTSSKSSSIGWVGYDNDTKTVTLHDAYIDNHYGFANIQLWGSANDTVTICLEGYNEIEYKGSGYGDGICSEPNLVFTGNGSLTIKNTGCGVKSDGDITIKSGTFSTDSLFNGFSCENMYVKGGKLKSIAGGSNAVIANSMSNSPSQLGYINGKLPQGATFAKSGNTYQVNSENGSATLVKYASAKTSATVNTVNFGYKYRVNVVGANAFAKTKVKKVTLGSNVNTVKKKAFYKTSKLTKLTIKDYAGWNGVTFQSKSLSKAGKKSGKKLTVKVQTYKSAKDVKSELRQAGLNKKAKVRTFSD